jgi:hypothetical protein
LLAYLGIDPTNDEIKAIKADRVFELDGRSATSIGLGLGLDQVTHSQFLLCLETQLGCISREPKEIQLVIIHLLGSLFAHV